MPRIPTISRAALLKLQAKSTLDKPAEDSSKTDTKKKSRKKPASKR